MDKKFGYLVEKLWTDSMENEVSASSGYAPHLFFMDKAEADTFVSEGGVMPVKHNAWPDVSGMLVYKLREIEVRETL